MVHNKNIILQNFISHRCNLPEPEVLLLQLYLEEKLTQKEMAKRLGLSISQLKQRLSKALFVLRRVGDDEDFRRGTVILNAGKYPDK